MDRKERLRKGDDIRAVLRKGNRIETKWFTMNYHVRGDIHSRFTAILGRSFGTAVVRNRAKRKTRHLFYLIKDHVHPTCDILLRPKERMLEDRLSQILLGFEKCLKHAGLYRKTT